MATPSSRKTVLILHLLLLLIFLAPLVGSFAWTPAQVAGGALAIIPACSAGAGCRTCGLTRGFCSVGHGEFARAQAYHPASLPLYLLCIVMTLFCAVSARAAWSIKGVMGGRFVPEGRQPATQARVAADR